MGYSQEVRQRTLTPSFRWFESIYPNQYNGVSPSGKASDSDSDIPKVRILLPQPVTCRDGLVPLRLCYILLFVLAERLFIYFIITAQFLSLSIMIVIFFAKSFINKQSQLNKQLALIFNNLLFVS